MDLKICNISRAWRTIFSLCFVCLHLSVSAGATSGMNTSNEMGNPLPNPWKDPQKCQRTISDEKSWICDADGVLTKAEADAINHQLVSINANASCVCNCSSNSAYGYDSTERGYMIAAITIRTLGEDDLPVANRSYDIERFSNLVRQVWFDNRTCEDTALVLAHYMYNCSKIHISLGDNLWNLLPDLSPIYKAAQPSLKTGNIGQALLVTIQKLNTALEKAINAPTEPPPDNLAWGILGVITVSSILLFHYWIKY